MFLLDEKIIVAVPFISIWKNEEQLTTNSKFSYMQGNIELPNGKIDPFEGVRTEIKRWEEIFTTSGKVMTGGIIRDSFLSLTIDAEEKKSIVGISSEFAKIKNIDQLINFAHTYGNLGLFLRQKEIDIFQQLNKFDSSISLTIENAIANALPGFTYFEPFELWWYHIKNVRKILKLHRALSRLNQGLDAEIEDTILKVGEEITYKEGFYTIDWFDDKPTFVTVSEEDLMNFVKIGRLVLSESIERCVSQGIKIKVDKLVETPKNNLGFYVLEKKTTEYLITAIYYDLWQLINQNMVVEICRNPECKLPFMKTKRQQYCSDACKQEAYRIRKAGL